ncbi:hypothetical protein BDZ97DRAFT_1644839, partial [Flammula alnicola]
KILQKKRNYEAEREALLLQIEELDAKIIGAQAEYGARVNSDIPILTLPTEITRLLFHDEEDKESKEIATDSLIEVVISHVCHQWRSISVAIPELWTTFCYDGPRASKVPLDRLDAYLQRSENRLLELWFKFRGAGKDEGHLTMLEKAITHVARWQRVTIISDRKTPILRLLPQLRSLHAPNLEYFAMCPDVHAIESASPTKLRPLIIGGGAPKLTSVWMDGSSPYTCLPPLSNITTLPIEKVVYALDPKLSWPAFLGILSIPTLTNLSLVGGTFELPHSFPEIDHVAMNNLKHLRYSSCDNMGRLLAVLRAPLLETLIIQNSRIASLMIALELPVPFPSLRSLWLVGIPPPYISEASDLVHKTCFATHVFISHETVNKSFLRSMDALPTEMDVKCWPNLQVLT